MPSAEVTPGMWKTHGFIVDQNLSKVANLLKENNVDCKVLEDSADTNQISFIAAQENRIFITNNLKVYEKKQGQPRGCLFARSNPLSKSYNLF
jgi:uncharacterized protein with PIN domain